MNKSFSDFTNQYSLDKTLRFSLIPVLTEKQEAEIKKEKGYSSNDEIRRQDRVEKFFIDNKKDVFEVDIEREKRYRALKYYLTELHKLFIKDALGKAKEKEELDFSNFFKEYEKFEKEKDSNKKSEIAKKINAEKVKLAKCFGDKNGKGGIFQETAKEYYECLVEKTSNTNIKGGDDKKKQFKAGTSNILLSENVLQVLKAKIGGGEIKEREESGKDGENPYALQNIKYSKKGKKMEGSLVDYFDDWTTYFKNFNEIRGNLYKDDGRKDEDNDSEDKEIKISKANAGQLTTRILDENFERFVRNAILAEKNKKLLKLSDFDRNDFINIDDNSVSIFAPEFYRHCFLQTDINNYNEKIADLNSFFNEKKRLDNKVVYLDTLHKQILLTDSLEEEPVDNFIADFEDDKDFVEGLEKWNTHTKDKIDIVSDFSSKIATDNNLSEINLNENQLHYFCNKYFGSWSYLRDLYYEKNKVDKSHQSKKKETFTGEDGSTKESVSLLEIKELLEKTSRDDFVARVKQGWFSFDELKKDKIYQEDVSNFDNFIAFLGFEIRSLLDGRTLLSEKEKEEKCKIGDVKKSLEGDRKNGERVDDLLLEKFSDDQYSQSISKSVETKQSEFESALEKLDKAVQDKKKLSPQEDFDYRRAINEYCTRVSDINRFFALFVVPEGVKGCEINKVVRDFKDQNKIVPLFNAIRNYATRRLAETEKVKLNFDESTLLGGWAYRTTDYKCRLYKKDNTMYLGIVGGNKSHPRLNQEFSIMNYYQIKAQTIGGSTYKGLFGEKYAKHRKSLKNEELLKKIIQIIDEELKLITEFPKVKDKLEKIKDGYKKGVFNFEIKKDDIQFEFETKTGSKYDEYKKRDKKDIVLSILKEKCGNTFDTDTEGDYLYKRIQEMFGKSPKRENFWGIDKMLYELTKLEPYFYKISFTPVQSDTKDTHIKALFQIYCKDFSPKKREDTTKNLHTLYFEALFSEKNQEKSIFKLSGQAEIFFREKIDAYKVEQWEQKDLKKPKTEKLPNKKRRFTEKQILFHVPIVANNINQKGNVNKKINKYIQDKDDIKILGIDRGERELAYYCLLDKDGTIYRKPTSMNTTGSNIIYGKKQEINYRTKLDVRERERMLARRSWHKIETIKDLKSGYIANVVHDIASLMVEENAMVCLEELNHGFKKDRSIRIEKGVYQRLENALVDKLNYLVLDKTATGVREALQLAPENKALKYWGNQMGAIFYTDAKFTSKTCPHCGFRRRGIEAMKTAKEVKEKVANKQLSVYYEREKDRFRIEYFWKIEAFDFGCENLYGKEKREVIYSDVERSRILSHKDKNKEKNGNNKDLKDIFPDYLEKEGDLFKDMNEKSFRYTDFGKVFNSLTWLRQDIKKDGKEHDCISCPKCHFSTVSPRVQNITNGDANGAYNIARRGLMIFEKIRSDKLKKKASSKDGIKSGDLKINLKEWDEETYKQWDKKDWEESDNSRFL